eukprot:CAMPEP_0185176122 /NCGR_PEP_ID=MMETSP1139-20130426/27868_1 /TAXON_ID=298111 /ORGANISM="Pavlova sp., Strain CCMP459" /LENGTH=99 /DNA_ID=CAMNT_0027741875 /DNA_START=115 /DNA_END=411 /DNA_ORIENTATION=-
MSASAWLELLLLTILDRHEDAHEEIELIEFYAARAIHVEHVKNLENLSVVQVSCHLHEGNKRNVIDGFHVPHIQLLEEQLNELEAARVEKHVTRIQVQA